MKRLVTVHPKLWNIYHVHPKLIKTIKSKRTLSLCQPKERCKKAKLIGHHIFSLAKDRP